MEGKFTESELIRKWMEGSLSEAEQTAFDQLPCSQSYKRIGETTKQLQTPVLDLNASYDAIRSKQHSQTKVKQLAHTKKWLQIAASIAILLTIGYFTWFSNNETKINTHIAQQENVRLPDASEVVLNAQSHLRFTRSNWKNNRNVNLKGQAYFKVAKGKKFRIETPQGNVQVLGTQFNVIARTNLFEVVCYEGKVAVYHQYKEYILPAGHKLTITANQIKKGNTIANSPMWIHHESNFTSMPLQFVLNELKRQYPIKLELENVNKNQLFTGTFSHKNLELALQSICLPLQLGYHTEGDKVLLYDKK